MLAILNFLNAHDMPIFQPILMILVSKFMVHRALSDKAYLSLGLLSPLTFFSNELNALHSSPIFILFTCTIPAVSMHVQAEWKTVLILADLDLQCFQKGINPCSAGQRVIKMMRYKTLLNLFSSKFNEFDSNFAQMIDSIYIYPMILK